MSKIGIVGLGKVGGRLAEAILGQADVEEVWLDTRDKIKLAGFLLSLQVMTVLIKSNVRVLAFDINRLNELDLIIICAKEHYDPRQLMNTDNLCADWLPNNLRYVGFLHDYPLLKGICYEIKEYQGMVAVVTNPVEVNTFFVAKWLPKARVVGLGASIDASRFLFALRKSFYSRAGNGCRLAEEYGSERTIHDVDDACVLAGEHGFSLIPILDLWHQNKDLKHLSDYEIKMHLDEAIAIGFTIVKSLGYTLHDCIPAFLEDICWLLQAGNQRRFRSVAVPIEISCATRPIMLGSNHEVIEFSNYSPNEMEQLNDTISRLGNIITSALLNIEGVVSNPWATRWIKE